ncbi:type II toxin-antitoxin system VapC family toxin [uncultured Sphingomonas sp.]|uniref:type II toxin-antitoxin system VapC family toxin n=1 Tax=uncultured Sphingomonas sp. TaxID=158754 RepID=UPI0025D95504|nr:type II toxin-antitoxin system VapC family toxin [uncultured Sphingomonas sp.]
MKYLLDSNIVIGATLAIGEPLRRRMADCNAGDMVMSSIVYAEVAFGCMQAKPPAIAVLHAFVEEVPIVDFDATAAIAYAGLPFRRASYDRLIAAHALALQLTLVTDNIAHFADIPGLRVENWTA